MVIKLKLWLWRYVWRSYLGFSLVINCYCAICIYSVEYWVILFRLLKICVWLEIKVSVRYQIVGRVVDSSYIYCPACRTSLIATRFWVVVICPIIKCLTVLEFSFILFDLCLSITIFNFILNYVPIVTFWIFTYHKIWILLIIFCFIWNYWIIYHSTYLEVFWSVVS